MEDLFQKNTTTGPRITNGGFDVSLFNASEITRRTHPSVDYFHNNTLPNARAVVEVALAKFGSKKLAIAFNGGKDCTVLLHLVLDTLKTLSENSSELIRDIPIVYFRSRPQFQELEDFIREKVQILNLNLCVYEGNIKESLAKFKTDFPVVEGIFMGTRCKDPESRHLSHFSPTDPDWPSFMRILPILNFSYHDVWLFLKELNIYYCKLYDDGYTSIGWEGNTVRNQKLRRVGEDGVVKYLPAYMLEDSDDERANRE